MLFVHQTKVGRRYVKVGKTAVKKLATLCAGKASLSFQSLVTKQVLELLFGEVVLFVPFFWAVALLVSW